VFEDDLLRLRHAETFSHAPNTNAGRNLRKSVLRITGLRDCVGPAPGCSRREEPAKVPEN
jgi:hypothetical protein